MADAIDAKALLKGYFKAAKEMARLADLHEECEKRARHAAEILATEHDLEEEYSNEYGCIPFGASPCEHYHVTDDEGNVHAVLKVGDEVLVDDDPGVIDKITRFMVRVQIANEDGTRTPVCLWESDRERLEKV